MLRTFIMLILLTVPMLSLGSVQSQLQSVNETDLDAALDERLSQRFKAIENDAEANMADYVAMYHEFEMATKDPYLQLLFFDSIKSANHRLNVAEILLTDTDINCRTRLYIKVLGYSASNYHSIDEVRALQKDFREAGKVCQLDKVSDAFFLVSRILTHLLVHEETFDEGVAEIRNTLKAPNFAHANLFAKSYLNYLSAIEVPLVCMTHWQTTVKYKPTATASCPLHDEAFDRLVEYIPVMEKSENYFIREYLTPYMHFKYGKLLQISRKHNAHAYAVNLVEREFD